MIHKTIMYPRYRFIFFSNSRQTGSYLCPQSRDHYYLFDITQDLISLLDAGINADHPSVIIDADAMFSEDMFGYAAQSRAARSSGINIGKNLESDLSP